MFAQTERREGCSTGRILSPAVSATDAALVPDSAEQFRCIKRQFGLVCNKRKSEVNAQKKKASCCGKIKNCENSGAVSSFKYLYSFFNEDLSPQNNVKVRVGQQFKTFDNKIYT